MKFAHAGLVQLDLWSSAGFGGPFKLPSTLVEREQHFR
jgi:hypothetical protein